MTVPEQDAVVRLKYTGPGNYDYDFKAYDEEDLLLIHISTLGVTKTLTLATDYTVTLNPDYSGGRCAVTITDTAGFLYIYRKLDIAQQTDLVNGDAFDQETVERALDEIIMIIQQLNDAIDDKIIYANWKGDWEAGGVYEVNNLVTAPDGSIYVCIEAHTASSSFDFDLSEGYWLLVVDIAAIKGYAENAAQSEYNALQSENAAAASASSAAASEEAAAQSEVQALSAKTAACACASEAASSASDAEDSAAEAAAVIVIGERSDAIFPDRYTATAGQTDFAITNPAPEENILVFFNSRYLRLTEDYTLNSAIAATVMTLNDPAELGDEIDMISFNTYDLTGQAADLAVALKTVEMLEAQMKAVTGYYHRRVLPAISKVILATAPTSVFVWDTTRDFDGGLWRERSVNASWFKTSGPAPEVIILLTFTTAIVAIDATQATAPIWRVFPTTSTPSSGLGVFRSLPTYIPNVVKALDGKIFVGLYYGDDDNAGLHCLDLAKDIAYKQVKSSVYCGSIFPMMSYTAQNINVDATTYPPLPGNAVFDIDVARVPGRALDPETGMPEPMVLMATNEGACLKDGPAGVGTVVDLTYNKGTLGAHHCLFNKNGGVSWTSDSAGYGDKYLLVLNDLPEADSAVAPDGVYGIQGEGEGDVIIKSGASDGITSLTERYIGTAVGGLTIAFINYADHSRSIFYHVTTAGSYGPLVKDTIGAWFDGSDTGATSADIEDAGHLGSDLTITGSLSRAAVETGADAAAFSGFTAANYPGRAADTNFNRGTNPWSIVALLKSSAATQGVIFDWGYSTGVGVFSGAAIQLALNVSGQAALYVTDDGYASSDGIATTRAVADSLYHLLIAQFTGTHIQLILDGIMAATPVAAGFGNLDNANATLKWGVRNDLVAPFSTGSIVHGSFHPIAFTEAEAMTMWQFLVGKVLEDAKVLLSPSNSIRGISEDKVSGEVMVALYGAVNKMLGVNASTVTLTPATDSDIQKVAAHNKYLVVGNTVEALCVKE